VRDLIQRLEEIDHRLGGKGAVNLPAAVKEAMSRSKKERAGKPKG
jgi:hypothetical protein